LAVDNLKENLSMNARIAIPVSSGDIFQHFGKSNQFKIFTVSDGKVTQTEDFISGDAGHEELGFLLVCRSVNIVICGGIGPGALGALAGAGIRVVAGIEGNADNAVIKFLEGNLEGSESATCGSHAQGGCAARHGCGSCRARGCGGKCGGSAG
jgi:predicted Fe-Mo cluster-binding NifX family protein